MRENASYYTGTELHRSMSRTRSVVSCDASGRPRGRTRAYRSMAGPVGGERRASRVRCEHTARGTRARTLAARSTPRPLGALGLAGSGSQRASGSEWPLLRTPRRRDGSSESRTPGQATGGRARSDRRPRGSSQRDMRSTAARTRALHVGMPARAGGAARVI